MFDRYRRSLAAHVKYKFYSNNLLLLWDWKCPQVTPTQHTMNMAYNTSTHTNIGQTEYTTDRGSFTNMD